MAYAFEMMLVACSVAKIGVWQASGMKNNGVCMAKKHGISNQSASAAKKKAWRNVKSVSSGVAWRVNVSKSAASAKA